MKVVCDAGPLIALAKIGGLEPLFDLYPRVFTPPAVFAETVQKGHYARAPDATLIHTEYEAGRLCVKSLQEPTGGMPEELGQGELESIYLAQQIEAEWLLLDDLRARRSAARRFRAHNAQTRIKGTLGIISSAYFEGLASLEQASQLLRSIRSRKDIWISAELCQRVEDTLLRAEHRSK